MFTESPLPEKYVITIGRSFGSGGRALGRMLAERLGIDFYDKELLYRAAEKAGLNPEYIERNDERAPRFISGLIPFAAGYYPMSWFTDPASISSDNIYKAQCELIRELAAGRPCVIVGRSADYVLRDYPNLVSIFVHAPVDECVRRIVGRGECTDIEAARTMAERTNRLRANYYNFYTDRQWGHAATYDLTFDSSKLPLRDIADLVIAYLRRRFASANP